jgi:hypothetical protein
VGELFKAGNGGLDMKIIYYLIRVFGYSLLLINYGCDAMPNLQNPLKTTLNGCPEKPDLSLENNNVKTIELRNQMLTESGIASQSKSIGYSFEANAGQKLNYKIDKDICIWVFTPDNQLLNSGVLPQSGKYTIQVSALKGSTTFELAMGLDVVLPSPTNTPNSSTAISSPPTATPPQFSLSNFPKSTCGDPLPTNPNDYPVDFYPVFVPGNESNLQLARSRFCRDALLRKRKDTGIRAIQVASFTSQQRAIEFRNILNSEFRGADIGPPTTIPNQP